MQAFRRVYGASRMPSLTRPRQLSSRQWSGTRGRRSTQQRIRGCSMLPPENQAAFLQERCREAIIPAGASIPRRVARPSHRNRGERHQDERALNVCRRAEAACASRQGGHGKTPCRAIRIWRALSPPSLDSSPEISDPAGRLRKCEPVCRRCQPRPKCRWLTGLYVRNWSAANNPDHTLEGFCFKKTSSHNLSGLLRGQKSNYRAKRMTMGCR